MSFNQSLFRNSVFWFALIPLFAVWGFWVTYFTRPAGSYDSWEHVHGFAMFAWCFMLILQAFLIRTNRRPTHRLTGRLSFLLVPLIIVSTLALAHVKLNARALNDEGLYVFGLQIFILFEFVVFYSMAMVHHRSPDVHARWMICTAFTLLDPIFARAIGVNFYPVAIETGQIQYMTFALIDVILVVLVWKDWTANRRRDVFLPALVLSLACQAAMLWGWRTSAWSAFAAWYAGI